MKIKLESMKLFFSKRIFRVAGLAIILTAQAALIVVGQEVVDKTVATVGDGARVELITYSDLLWFLAVRPQQELDAPTSESLNLALQSLINQRLFALEAERLPRAAPTEKEISDEIARLLQFFPSIAVFEARLKQVGFDSIRDEAFVRIIARRLATEKYIDFRFRSFAVVTPDEETKYYRDTFVPDFRRRYPGLLVPTLEDRRAEIRNTLIEIKVAERIDAFLEDKKRRAEVVVLIEV